jgi:hypothetical protein
MDASVVPVAIEVEACHDLVHSVGQPLAGPEKIIRIAMEAVQEITPLPVLA